MQFENKEKDIRIRELEVKDIEIYFKAFEERFSLKQRKELIEQFKKSFLKRNPELGHMNLIVERISDEQFIGMFEIINKNCMGQVVTSIPNDDLELKYGIDSIDTLIQMCKEYYIYDDLILSIEVSLHLKYIEQKGCYANIRIAS